MSIGVPAGNLSSRGRGSAGAEIAAADSDGWIGFVADSVSLADWAARLEERKTMVKITDIELLIDRSLLMNRVVVHEEGKRSAMRADEKGSPPNKNAWQSRHAFNCQRNLNTT